MIELHVKKSDEGQRINKYMLRYLNAAPSSFIYKMFRKKNILLNQKKIKGSEILHESDIISVYLSDLTIKNFRGEIRNAPAYVIETGLKVLYRDDDIMAVHKPAGVLSQKASASDYSVNEQIIDYCIQNEIISQDGSRMFTPSVCNRLDRNTSGIILAGISLKGSRYLSDILKKRSLDKYYYTVVAGVMTSEYEDTAYIRKNPAYNISDVISTASYKKLSVKEKQEYDIIKTRFIPMSTSSGYSLLLVKLITGRSHQIRAHLKYLGYSVIGDTKYGDKKTNEVLMKKYGLKYQLLHAALVVMPYDGGTLEITDKPPELFVRVCEGLDLKVTDLYNRRDLWQRGIQEA